MKTLFLLLATSLHAGNYTAILTTDTIFANFTQAEASHSGYPILMGVKVSRSIGELSLFVKYSQSLAPTIFKYSTDADSYNGYQKFAQRHFDMEYHTSINIVSMGMDVQQSFDSFLVDVSISLGRANFTSHFVHTESDTADESVNYATDNITSDAGITLSKSFGHLLTGINFGYLFANAGNDSMKATQDYSLNGRQQITKGSSIVGDLDYSGFRMGINLGFSF